ncbi:MAG: hypothetical protein IJU45_01095 [Clostridia bacterium]|nr:hypothetical protein [Clostridia bacterium]
MSDKIIRNKSSKEVGYIKTDTKGVQTAYNLKNQKLGSFDPNTNFTKDVNGRIVGSGNMLTQLIIMAG